MFTSRRVVPLGPCLFLLITACSRKEGTPPTTKEQPKKQALAPTKGNSAIVSSLNEPPSPSNSLVLPVSIERHTGDLDEMVRRRNIRALVACL